MGTHVGKHGQTPPDFQSKFRTERLILDVAPEHGHRHRGRRAGPLALLTKEYDEVIRIKLELLNSNLNRIKFELLKSNEFEDSYLLGADRPEEHARTEPCLVHLHKISV